MKPASGFSQSPVAWSGVVVGAVEVGTVVLPVADRVDVIAAATRPREAVAARALWTRLRGEEVGRGTSGVYRHRFRSGARQGRARIDARRDNAWVT